MTSPSPASPAEVVAVPLTAASSQIASAGAVHQDLVPPWTLTASDGSGLMLVRVDAKAVLEGPLAFTELHLYFHNSEDRRREGTFQITLPPHAAVSRFAMENDGQWMEAEVVEKQLARRAYDDFLHRKQDPALLEKAAGNQFTAKVFPIPAKADKHIVISYSQELPGAQYVLPLRGLPKIERVDVALDAIGADGKRTPKTLSERNWQPDRDFASDLKLGAAGVIAGNMVASQIAIDGAGAAEPPGAITLLVDTSASRALGYEGYIQGVHELIGKLAARYHATIDVVAFDQDAQRIFSGRAADWGAAQDKQLIERGAAGASDLGQALAFVEHPAKRVVIVTDGVITAGAEAADLAKRAGQLAGVDRLDVVLAGGIRDDELATTLVRAHLPHAGAVLDLDAGADAVAARLAAPVLTDISIAVPGAAWSYPRTIASAQAGDTALVYARLAKPAQAMTVMVAGKPQHLALVAGTQPLVERAAASAEIAELEAKLAVTTGDAAKPLRADIAKRSIAARVISSQTSLLVLESDDDFARYGIDRKALADVLVIGPHGIERHHDQTPAQIAQPEVAHHRALPKVHPGDVAMKRSAVAGKSDQDDLVELFADADGKDESGGFHESRGLAFESEENFVAEARISQAPATQPATTPEPPPPPPRPAAPGRHVADPVARAVGVRNADVEESSGARIAGGEALEARDDGSRQAWPPKDAPVALTGELAAIEHALAAHDVDGALAKARDWHARVPGDVLALIGLGDALEAKGSVVTAARVYGSIIDLFPGRADLRRFAGERLARIQGRLQTVPALIVDTYRRAVADRPDHLTGHRLLAYALVRAGQPDDAFAEILAAIDHPYRTDSYAGAQRVLADDAGMIGAAYLAAQPNKRAEILAELGKRHLELATKPSTRFILYWETDGNDVDFHIQDARGNHAFYGHKPLASGGELYADITTGYGPECFAIPGTPKAGPYRLSINYYSQGPMGYGMGLLEVQRFDGKGTLAFEDRPYVIMNDHAYVDLGVFQ